MRIAADAGIFPRLHYVNETDRVVVVDFIEHARCRALLAGVARAQALGALLRGLQTTPPLRFCRL